MARRGCANPGQAGRARRGSGRRGDGAILSPLPGRIIAVEVREGQSATKGQKLLTLYEMTMEHTLTAPFDRTVTELKAFAGAQDSVDAQLVRLLESAGA